MDQAELESALARVAWQALGRADAPASEAIHPDDEMYTWLAEVGVAPANRRAYYLREGVNSLELMEHVAASTGRSLAGIGSILEFASGFGRLTRHLVRVVPAESVWCAEILPEAVRFSAEEFGVNAILSATEPDAFALDERFGMIFVGSLFSHLPRRRFGPWLRRLYDHLAPDGVLVISTQGPHTCKEVPMDPSGFTFLQKSESGSLDLAEYGATWVAEDTVREIAREQRIDDLRYAPSDLWGSQDIFLASPGKLPDWTHTPRTIGAFLDVKVDDARQAWISGWARTRVEDGPPTKVELQVLDAGAFPAVLAEPKPWGPNDRFLHTEWLLQGDTSMLPAGTHAVAATARLASGRTSLLDVTPFELR